MPDDITINCNLDPNDLSITGDVTDESDNCDNGLEATYTDEVIDAFPCNGASLIIRTWSLVDNCW